MSLEIPKELPKTAIEKVVFSLRYWNYNLSRASPFNISRDLDISESAVIKAIRILKADGVIKKSSGGSWVLTHVIPKEVIANAIHEETK